MKGLGILYAFLGGAVVGCAAALLFAPEKGEDVRQRLCTMLRRKGVKFNDADVDALVAELSADVD